MNKQIKQLAEQATTYIDPSANDGVCWAFDREKFAQLILQECLTICQYNTDDDDDQFDLGRVHQAKEITQLIKIHFGVEP
jgi:hypothetical protein